MGTVKVRYYTTRPRAGVRAGYWQPTKAMQAEGFRLASCGPDGPAAWRIAEEWNRRWDACRTTGDARRWPIGSLGAAFEDLRAIPEVWAVKALRTREDWFRGWRYIEPVFGDVNPATVTVATIAQWYGGILKQAGAREAHRAMKIWRALWQQAAQLRYCDPGRDPSASIRRVTPAARQEVWREGEVVHCVKRAWRLGYHGLAALAAVAWDTSFSPVDCRKLTFAAMAEDGGRIKFALKRSKTGQAAIGTLGARAGALVRAYIGELPGEALPTAPIFRNRSGRPYSKDTLGDDWRDVRGAGETRTLADMRRSGAVEANAGDASDESVSAKLANSIATNRALRKIYLPVNLAAVEIADRARIVGRGRLRNKPASKL